MPNVMHTESLAQLANNLNMLDGCRRPAGHSQPLVKLTHTTDAVY